MSMFSWFHSTEHWATRLMFSCYHVFLKSWCQNLEELAIRSRGRDWRTTFFNHRLLMDDRVFLVSFHWTLGHQAYVFLLSCFLEILMSKPWRACNSEQGTRLTNHIFKQRLLMNEPLFWHTNPSSAPEVGPLQISVPSFQTPFVDGWATFSGMAQKPPGNESKPLCRLVGTNPRLQPVPMELARTIWLTTDEPLFWHLNTSLTPRNGFTTDIRAIFSNTISRLSSHFFDIGAVF